MIRSLIPDDQPVLATELTEEYVVTSLGKLDVKPNTKRNYVMAWLLFVRWSRRKGAPIPRDPFEFAEEWVPGPGRPRSVVWSHAQRLAVLDQLDGAPRAAIALMLGSGMELSAVLRLQEKDIDASTRTVFADGSITDYRSRHVTVDMWAWPFVDAYTSTVHVGRVFPWSAKTKGRALRETFYQAQVRAEMCGAPPTSGAGYAAWGAVAALNTIHDCRSSYAVSGHGSRRRTGAGQHLPREPAWARERNNGDSVLQASESGAPASACGRGRAYEAVGVCGERCRCLSFRACVAGVPRLS